LITGDDAQSGFVAGKPNYVIIYGEGCFNSKRQARRTVDLYSKYRSKVHFVVIDLELGEIPGQIRIGRRATRQAAAKQRSSVAAKPSPMGNG
jgi:hypothetical protein